MFVHIHAPKPTIKKIHIAKCPDCNKRSRFLQFYTPYYGWDTTCILCGRNWQDGEWMPLEFARGIRKHMIANAKHMWRTL